MSATVTLPVLGFDMTEAAILEWHKEEGDAVALDEPLVTAEIDKGTVEVPSTVAGILVRRLVAVGDVVAVHSPVAEIDPQADAGA